MLVQASTTPSATMSSTSRRLRPRSSRPEDQPDRDQRNCEPHEDDGRRPDLVESDFANVAPTCTETAAPMHEQNRPTARCERITCAATTPAPIASSTMPSSRGQCSGIRSEPEEAPAVDRRAHRELAGDEDPDRRRDADARACVRDREDDQQAHDAAAEHPPRLVQRPRVAGDASSRATSKQDRTRAQP